MANKAVGFLTFNFGANMGGFNKAMKKAQRRVKKFGSSMKRVGSSMSTNLTMPIIGLGAVAIKTFANFEQAMLKVKAVSGATGEQFKMLESDAKRLGSSTMFTASQVAELQLELSKLGFTPEEINKSTEAILSLAQATGHDLAESATIVASTMNSFNMEASESTKVADMFAVASSSAAIDMEKLSIAMPTVGATAGAVGVPLGDLTSMMMTLSDSGMQASKMGTHLRKIFVELATKGISYDDAMNQINSSTNKVKTATELFGGIAFSSAITLANNTQKTEDYSKALDESAGKSKEMAAIMDSGAAGAMRRLASQAEGVAISLGEMLIPIFTKLMDFIQKSLNWWSGLDQELKNNIVTIGLIVAAIGPVLTILGTLTTAFAAVLSPIGLVVAAAVAAGVLIYQNWEPVKKTLVDVINYFIDLYNESVVFKGIIEGIKATFLSLWSTVKFFFKQSYTILKNFGKQFTTIFSGIGQMIKGVFTGSWETIKEGADKMGEALDDVFDSEESKKNVEDWVNETNGYLENAISNVKSKEKIKFISEDDVQGAVDGAADMATGVYNKIKDIFAVGSGGSGATTSEGGDEPIIGHTDPVETYEEMMDRLYPVAETTTKTLGEIWDNFYTDWGDSIKQATDIAKIAMSSIGELASSVAQKETTVLENEKAKQQELHDADYERQLSRIENGVMDEEAKQEAIDELNASFAEKKAIMDEQMAQKEKAIKIKQAKRNKAMGIANGIISGVEAVMNVLANVPFPANIPLSILVGGMAAANVATIASTPIPAFADGGIISGPTVGLMGEYPGAGAGNPEVVAPLKKLQGMMNGSSQQVEVTGKISGNDILLISQKAQFNRNRFV